jgi:hypothetical protein
VGVSTAKASYGVCCVLCVVSEGEGRASRPMIRWMQGGIYGCVRGNHRSEHRFEACGDTIAGKGGVEAGIIIE